MTQNKLHRILPFLVLAAMLMLCVNTDAQRARNRRGKENDILRNRNYI